MGENGRGVSEIMAKVKIRQTKKRYLWADIIRVVAIFLVVYIHTPSNFHISPNLTLLSVPLFFMLSGALLLNKEESISKFFIKRVVKILIPWVFWTIIYVTYFEVNRDVNHLLTISSILRDFIRTMLSFFWFLPIIFNLYLITPFFRILLKHSQIKNVLYLIVLWFITLSLLPLIVNSRLFPRWEESFVYSTIQYSGYYLLGSVLLKIPRISFNPIFLAFLFIVTMTSCFFGTFFTDPFIVIASTAAFMSLYIFSGYLEIVFPKKIKQFIAGLSGTAFGIYLTHQIIAKLLEIGVFGKLHFADLGLLYTLMIFLISSAFIYFLQKIPIIKYIVS